MIVEIGGRGLENSWQAPFPETVKCVHCSGVAIPAVSIMEEGGKPPGTEYICDLPVPPTDENTTKALWPHNATAFTIYLCLSCLEPTALFNQA